MSFPPYPPSLPNPNPTPSYKHTFNCPETEPELFFHNLEIDAFPRSAIARQMMSYLAWPERPLNSELVMSWYKKLFV